MGTVPVDIFITSDDASPAPIAGAVVTVLDLESGLTVAGQAPTDSGGKAAFALDGRAAPGGHAYEVRLYKLGVIFGGPKQIIVQDPPEPSNAFDVSGSVITLPFSPNPRTCRCTGRFMNFAGQPIAGATLRIMAKAEAGFQVPKVVDGNLISAETMHYQSDAHGVVSTDLLRGGEYYVMFSGEDDVVWNIKVPDRVSVNLIDLIHPQPVSLTWDSTVAPGNTLSLKAGEQVCVPMSVIFSDFEVLTSGLSSWLQLVSSDTTKVMVTFSAEAAVVKGLLPGTAEIGLETLPRYPKRVPDYSITYPPLLVTVTT